MISEKRERKEKNRKKNRKLFKKCQRSRLSRTYKI